MLRRVACFILLAFLSAVPAPGAGPTGGGALVFDGIDDYVEIPAPLNITDGLTIEAWIRLDSISEGFILSNHITGGGYGMEVYSDGKLTMMINDHRYMLIDLQDHLGEWIHVALTWSGPTGGYISGYVDGVMLAGSMCHLTEVPSTTNLQIGSRPSGTPGYFPGAIDEVRVFDTALPYYVIQEWMTRIIGPDHPQYAHLLGAWSFDDGSGQVLTGLVPGTDGRLGITGSADASDPTWSDSGMVGSQTMAWGTIKALYAR